MTLSRRRFMKVSLVGGATALVPFMPFSAWAGTRNEEDPHFFIHYLFYGGFDWSYLFDARPLQMTQAGLIQNYFGQEPGVWEGTNGTRTRSTSAAEPLRAQKDYFSILNGVHMMPAFDGHIQSANFLMSGNPFGGKCFLPDLNFKAAVPIDGLLSGTNPTSLSNMAGFVPLTVSTGQQLVKAIQGKEPIDTGSRKWKYVLARYAANVLSTGGSFSLTSSLLGQNVSKAAIVESIIRDMKISPPGSTDPATVPFMNVVGPAFRSGLARSVFIVEDLKVDTHAPADAKQNPEKAKQIVSRIQAVIQGLRDTPYDSQRSLLDVTSFVFGSEFARTMRQPNYAIDASGSDHGNLTNTLIVGGKAFRGGRVIGESDFAASDETLSPAHLSVDASKLKTMGRPFDFATLKPKAVLPAQYDAADYLTINSVVNTIYASFGVPTDRYRLLGRDGPIAPVLNGLLS